MRKVHPYLKNKFIITLIVFVFYSLFLDENDLFTMISNSSKLSHLEVKKTELNLELKTTTGILKKLKSKSEVERYARENKYFKKDDEDLFVIYVKSTED
jgi:cell division protein DivIC